MKEPQSLSLLVALDGSERSLGTVGYLSQVAPLRRARIRLFHVLSGVPEAYWDLIKEPASIKPTSEILAWASQEREKMAKYLAHCREMLLAAGAAPERVETVLHERHQGIARDILAEARRGGYDALVFRRRGMSSLVGLTIGSVAQKLLHHLEALPVILAGRRKTNRRLLVAYDGSETADRAVDFVGRVMGHTDSAVTLVHVLRAGHMFPLEAGVEELMLAWAEGAATDVEAKMDKACERLVAAGLKKGDVQRRVVKNAFSRAGAVVDLAVAEDFGTIVVGRRGLSRVQEFTMGRVGNKILHLGREHTVWVVN